MTSWGKHNWGGRGRGLAACQAGVALGAADDELPGGVDVQVARLAVEQARRRLPVLQRAV